MLIADCKPPEMTYLIFGVGLPNNQASTVKKALQDTVMYLQMHGLPVYRFHSRASSTTTSFATGFEIMVFLVPGRSHVRHRAMVMQSRQCDG